jgi:hypothetical protein|nr:hypothetical protein [Paraburkholderia sp. BL8N3]
MDERTARAQPAVDGKVEHCGIACFRRQFQTIPDAADLPSDGTFQSAHRYGLLILFGEIL